MHSENSEHTSHWPSGLPSHWPFGPKATSAIAAAALTGTAYVLGIDWLANPVFGLPAATWLIASAPMLMHIHLTGMLNPLFETATDSYERRKAAYRTRSGRYDLDAHLQAIEEQAAPTPAYRAGQALRLAQRSVERLSQKVLRRGTSLRIGLDLCESDRFAIMQALGERRLGAIPIEFEHAQAGLVAAGAEDCVKFDALLRRSSDGALFIFSPSDSERPAGWSDWSSEPPLSYASVYPMRVDSACVALDECDLSQRSVAEAVARLSVFAAIQSRSPARIGPAASHTAALSLPNYSQSVEIAASLLASAVSRATSDSDQSSIAPPAPATLVAARVLSAYFCGSSHASAAQRSFEHDSFVELLRDEPAFLLRRGATLTAAGEFDQATSSFTGALLALRSSSSRCVSDPLPFLLSEAELGAPDELTLGRIAGGVTLLWATAPQSSWGYLHDDLIDDLRHAGWLKNRPADAEYLQSLINTLTSAGTSTTQKRKAA